MCNFYVCTRDFTFTYLLTYVNEDVKKHNRTLNSFSSVKVPSSKSEAF